MAQTPNAFAYRCLPLAIANSHGWEMLCPFAFEAEWNGGPENADITLKLPEQAEAPQFDGLIVSHFGSGVLTFNPLVILQTEKLFNVWLAGPSNSFKDGIQPLSATIETDWMPYTFSMNWKFTRPNHPIRFEEGEPFCQFFPTERGVVARCEPTLHSLADHAELTELYQWALARRTLDSNFAKDTREQFQGWYTRGELPNKKPSGVEGHETTLRPKPFTS